MEDYFDIDAILSAEPRVYVTFNVAGKGLGHLGTDPDELDLPSGSRVALPFWLSESLAERRLVSVALPRCFTGKTRNALRADAYSVDLATACTRYYAMGVRVARLLRVPHIVPMLLQARATRAWRTVDAGQYTRAHSKLLDRLDAQERELFFAARGAAVARNRWVERRCVRIQTAATVARATRKRPLNEISPVTPRTVQRTRVS